MIKVSSPGKLVLFGEHAVLHGKPCIVTAIDQRMFVKIKRTNKDISVKSSQMGINKYVISLKELKKKHPKEIRFVLKSIENFFEKYKIKSGLKVETTSEFSSKIGFGTSAAVTVSTIKALDELFKTNMEEKDIFELAYKTVLDIQGLGSGVDIAASTYGGTLYYKNGGEVIKPIKTNKIPLVIGYTGIKADTTKLVKKVSILKKRYPSLVNPIFDLLEKINKEARKAMSKKDYKRLGELMNFNQGLLSAAKVSCIELERLINAAREAGAYGAKLSGAGGGDCMVAVVENRKRYDVEKAIRRAGGTVIKANLGAEGVRLEK